MQVKVALYAYKDLKWHCTGDLVYHCMICMCTVYSLSCSIMWISGSGCRTWLGSDSCGLQVLTTFGTALLALQPLQVPGWRYGIACPSSLLHIFIQYWLCCELPIDGIRGKHTFRGWLCLLSIHSRWNWKSTAFRLCPTYEREAAFAILNVVELLLAVLHGWSSSAIGCSCLNF